MKPLLIVDGYNVIGAWKEAEKHDWSLDESRDRLLRLLEDYSGYSGEEIVLVFDGYLSDRRVRTEEPRGNVLLVYTRHAETADAYIERLVATTPKYRVVRVATSDGLEQSQVLSTGAVRMTSRELLRELRQMRQQGMSTHEVAAMGRKSSLEMRLDSRTRDILEQMRRSAGEPEPPKPKPKPVFQPKPASQPKPTVRAAVPENAHSAQKEALRQPKAQQARTKPTGKAQKPFPKAQPGRETPSAIRDQRNQNKQKHH